MTAAQDQTITYCGESTTVPALLMRYNPKLVLLPRNPNWRRPGSWWRGRGRGDYHPCSAEFWLAQAACYEKRRGLFRGKSKTDPAGLDYLKEKVVQANGDTRGWEIDIAHFSSGDARNAWRVYGRLLEADPEARRTVAYGHFEHDGDRLALQYWYLYFFNDHGNTHEGDWETVTIELDRNTGPVRVGYSGHSGGVRRGWEGVTRIGERPIVYVARGSHAAYLDNLPLGHKTLHLDYEKGLVPGLQQVVDVLLRFLSKHVYFWGVRDYTPSIEDEGDGNQGVLVDPELRIMPTTAALDDPDWWWMNIRCRWGSSHTRLRDFSGPSPPWEKGEKWEDPLAWVAGLRKV